MRPWWGRLLLCALVLATGIRADAEKGPPPQGAVAKAGTIGPEVEGAQASASASSGAASSGAAKPAVRTDARPPDPPSPSSITAAAAADRPVAARAPEPASASKAAPEPPRAAKPPLEAPAEPAQQATAPATNTDPPVPAVVTTAESAPPAKPKVDSARTASDFTLLGASVPRGAMRQLQWTGPESFAGAATNTPILVAHGSNPGKVLCLTAAVHGDELNGIEIVRRVLYGVDPAGLSGTLVGVPIVNVHGFQRGSRYLPDRRDLNRYFPGDPRGSSASRIASAFFEQVIARCDYLVDLHTGSFHRTNLTQLRADLSIPSVRELCDGFNDLTVLHSVPPAGTLRHAAVAAGIPTVTVEAGEPLRLEVGVVERGVRGLRDLLGHLRMIPSRTVFERRRQPVYYRSTWVRAEQGGILLAKADLGDRVRAGDRLGSIIDPITNGMSPVLSTSDGTVLGLAVNQFVMPGFALFRIGIVATTEEFSAEPTLDDDDDEASPGADVDHEEDFGERPE